MGTIEVVAVVPAGRRLAPACRRLLGRLRRATARPDAGVTLILASDAAVRRLNRVFRGRDRTTDVLSFPAQGDLEPGRRHLGDIAISVPQASRQARRARWGVAHEVALLVTHGYLHLLGYDHDTDDGRMRRLEEVLLRRAAGVALAGRRLPWGMPPAGVKGGRPRRARRAEGGT